MKINLKNLFRSAVLGCVLLGSALVANWASAETLVTNFPSANGVYALFTNSPSRVSSIQILAQPNAPVIVYLYDTPYGTTNYTNAAYTSRIGYQTNIVTTYISALTGYTNYITNIGWFSATITNAIGTNNPLPYKAFAVQANTLGTFPVDYTFVRGITARATTNASIILTYQTNQ